MLLDKSREGTTVQKIVNRWLQCRGSGSSQQNLERSSFSEIRVQKQSY